MSQISIHKLEVFCLVVELDSVSLAAERLNIAQPVVSTHLKTLAQKFGTPLTRRQGQRVVLTETGARVHRWAREVVDRTFELEREMADSQRGVVGKASVGASMTIGSYVLPSIITAFRAAHPKGEVSVRVATPKLVTDAVQSGDCDFAFTVLDPRHELSGLDVEVLATEELVLVVADAGPITDRRLPLEALTDMPFVTAQHGTPRREIEEHLLSDFGVRRERIEMEFGHAEAIKQAVRAGAGAAFLFRSSIRDELAAGTLREIETVGMRLATPVYLVRRKTKRLSSFQSALLEHLAAMMRGAPPDAEIDTMRA